MRKVTGNKEKSELRINLEENWKVYLIYAAVAIAFVVWILSGRSENDTPEDREYLDELESTDYIAYTSYSGDLTSYLRLSESYEEAGYEGTDEVITLSPADAEVTAQDEDALQDAANALQTGIADYDGEALYLAENVDATWTFTAEEAGLYSIVLDYAGVEGDGSDIRRAFYIDGEAYCEEATSVRFYRYYVESGEVTVNAIGDEVWPTQEEVVCWMTQAAYDSAGYDPESMYFYLEAGTHTIRVAYVDQPVAIKEIRLEGKQEIPTYEEVLAEYEANGYEKASSGSGMYLEAEESTWRNDSIIRRESNNDPKTSPFSLTTRVLNTVGGSRWSDGEQSVSWIFTVEEDGLYEIALKVLQDDNEGLPVYRKVSIDGEVPYEEFLEYKFEYSTDWYSEVLSDADGNPYLVYLEAGEHELTLTAQLGDLSYVIERSENDAMVLSEIYRTVTKITGTDPDVNYEYNLYRQLPELSAQLTEVADSIEVTAEILNQICNMTTPEESTYRSIVSTLREFAEDVDKIPRNLTDLENAQSNLGTYVMTFFGAAADGADGYFFYPDGSGAIMEFDDPAHYSESSVTYTVYGNPQNFEELQSRFDDADPSVLLPVFGGNCGNNGFVAYITEGAESSKINVVPAGSTITANYMYPTFVYRRNFTDPRVSSRTVQTYSGAMLETDYEICYRLLDEGKAEYADMASAYREYLIESEGMTALEVSKDYALVLDLFMGIEEEGILFNTLQSMTTFSQAEEILEELTGEIDGELKVSLIGWTSDGYGCEPNYFPANSSLGGNSGLKSLANFAADNGTELSLAIDLLTVDSDAGGYSTTNDIVYLGNYQALTNRTEDMYVISPNVAVENFTRFMKKADKYSLSGVKLENLGNLVLYNYRSRNMVTTEECVSYWQDIIQTVKDSLGTVTVEGGNAYVLPYADLVTDIPISDCGYQMTTKSVPFYQIVAHGYVEYTGDALNLSSDVEKQILRWIEYGYLPYFELTYESPDNLIETDYSELFSSQYSAWKDTVVEAYEELSSVLSQVRTAAIVSHEEVADNVFCTGYDNGIRIYVNYSDDAVTADGVEIEGMSYVIVEGS